MKNAKSIIILTFVLYIIMMAGCQSIDRGYEKMVAATDPDRVKLNTSLKWLNPQPRIPPSSRRMVYARVRNSAGVDVDFSKVVQTEILETGYMLVYDPSAAQYILNVDVRHMGERAIKHGDAAVAGAVGGAVAGGVVGHNTKAGTGPGAVIGGIAGALLGNIVGQRNKDREYTFVVDVTLGERMDVGVSTSKASDTTNEVSSRAGSSGESGSSVASSSEYQRHESVEDFYFYENRVVISARSLNLKLHDAAPLLIRRASLAIASTLP
tara:strand:- start:13594 stop:14394 length:801 start_codon:yes stop_codon:yes gene_type:complete